jgi:arylsulfatase A-like enzyme
MKRSAIVFGVLYFLFLSLGRSALPEKPNVIIILTDDQGWADLSVQGVLSDVKTPNLDKLAASGVRFTDGYVTAPQCSPSRAGLITGRYQERFGLDQIRDIPMAPTEKTLADRLSAASYVTGIVGKWHLAPEASSKAWLTTMGLAQADPKTLDWHSLVAPYLPTKRGFRESFCGERSVYWATHDQNGKLLNPSGQWLTINGYRVDAQSDAAVSFVERNRDKPFFLYLAYFAPHNPAEATKKYLARFPGKMPERRRYALAMLSAVDDGVGRIVDTLKKDGLTGKTLIFFTSDNGAPYDLYKVDFPIGTNDGAWDGSLNDPMIGEKGMLSEAGIHMPMLASWPGVLPAGTVYHDPVISLDFAATALGIAGIPQPPELDGVNLIPFLTGQQKGAPHDALYWRFMDQCAIREGRWKYLQVGNDLRYLFDLSTPEGEAKNLITVNTAQADAMKEKLSKWAAQLQPAGLPEATINKSEKKWYKYYFNSIPETSEQQKIDAE